jgi:hypothetical protein
MNQTNDSKPEFYFMIIHKMPNAAGDYEYGYIRVHLMTIDENSKPCNVSYGEYQDLIIQASYLTVRRECEHQDNRCMPRHWDLEYRDVYTIALARAETMVRVLRKIDARLKSYEVNLGEALDFSSFVIRAGRALGVKGFFYKTHQGSGTAYADSEWTIYKLTDAAWLIGLELEKARERFIKTL